jgi:hypothetical protein
VLLLRPHWLWLVQQSHVEASWLQVPASNPPLLLLQHLLLWVLLVLLRLVLAAARCCLALPSPVVA